jgi:hypothetical protein
MTTREGQPRPAERAEQKAQTAPGSELSSRVGTGGDADEPEPLSGSVAAPPADARQLEREIERTREQLGDTVQELIARVDVKARALAKASEVSDKCKSTMVQARERAATRASGVRSQVTGNTAAARQKAASAGRAGKEQLRGRVAAVGTPAWEAMPEQMRGRLTKGASGARERWVPVTVAAGAVILDCLAVWQWRRDQ